ncbi:MAG: cytochrome c [Deltaproteobacteria bacterium]|nr:cytochrome c [Deltaproteobacteria bacterium]
MLPALFAVIVTVAAHAEEQTALGQRIYEERCLECHGPQGRGDGPDRWLLTVRPRDLTSEHIANEMSDDALFRVISEGIRPHSMPSFEYRLTEEERRAVISYVRTLAVVDVDVDVDAHGHGDETETDHGHEVETAAEHGHDGGGEHEHGHSMKNAKRVVPWPLTREASGTAWVPDSSPMFGLMRHDNGWMFMLHGELVSGFNAQSSDRGALQLTTLGWLMPMVSHDVPGGNLTARVMVSPEPFLLPGNGYPLLLQTGETFEGDGLHDRQHPHDLFMEVAALFRTVAVAGVNGELYVAAAGEPALGPAAFPHRVSAMGDPFAPLSHHWLDSTHIAFGVVTAGLATRTFKVEGSLFNGREPDEHRLDIELDVPRSWSTRVTVVPHHDFALQASYGRLVGPERLEPDEIVSRTTASLSWNRAFDGGNWAAVAAVGHNRSDDEASSAVLVESNLALLRRHSFSARAELVGKETKELDIVSTEEVVYVPGLGVGYQFVFDPAFEFVPAVGVRASASYVAGDVAESYRTNFPVGAFLYLMVRGAEMK